MYRVIVLCVALLIASPVAAGTIVTWQGSGVVDFSYRMFPNQVVPPVGTPLAFTLSFDPTLATPTISGSPGCMTVGLSGSFSVGDYQYNLRSQSAAFTHAQLPGTTCIGSVGGFTQFSLHDFERPPGTPWDLAFGPPILSYRDLLVQDAFPNTPTNSGFALFFYDNQLASLGFRGNLTLQAVEQPAAVPEPGTLTMLGIGLAAVARRIRRKTT